MLYTGRRLDEAEDAAVRAHLEECPACRSRRRDTHLAHIVLTSLSDMGLNEVEKYSRQFEPPQHRPKHFAFPLLPIASIVGVSLIVIALLFSPRFVEEVRADELLAKAAASGESFPAASAYRLQMGSTPCASMRNGAQFIVVNASPGCTRIVSHLSHTAWASGNPLSARTFNAWRNSLTHHRDHIVRNTAALNIETSSDTGLVRTANLELRKADMRPIGLTLRFDNSDEVRVSESEGSADQQPTLVVAVSKPSAPVDDPADLIEVNAWQTLHSLHADSGWEANVMRSGERVSVFAVAASDARKLELERGFELLSGIHTQIISSDEISKPVDFLPQRAFSKGGQALAESWLKKHFPDPSVRNAYKNDVVHLSRDLLGRALLVDRLEKRRAALASCSCSNEISRLLLSEEAELRTEHAALLTAILPLIDATEQEVSSKPISAEAARNLDLIVQQLLISSDEGAELFDSKKSSLRSILGLAQNAPALAEEKSTLHL